MEVRAYLLLVCAALVVLVHAKERCDTAQIGNETEVAYVLEEQRVQPDTITLEISEHDVCSDSEPTGLKVTACDADKAPRVFLKDTTRGLVERQGKLETAAYVYITVFCASDSEDSEAEPQSWWHDSFSTGTGTGTVVPPQLSPTPPANSPLSLNFELEPKSEDLLPSVQMESRFSSASNDALSSLGLLKGLVSRLNENEMEPFKRPLLLSPEGLSPLSEQRVSNPLPLNPALTRWQEDKKKLLNKSKHLFTTLPRFYDSYSSLENGPKDSSILILPSSSLTDKSLPSSGPAQETLLSNRAAAWLKRPKRRPTQKSLTWLHNRPITRPYGIDDEWWSPVENDLFRLNWAEDLVDRYPWCICNNQPVKPRSWQLRYGHPHGDEPTPLALELPMPLSKNPFSNMKLRTVPHIREDDAAYLAGLKQQHLRPLLPKLLLLLQDQQDRSTLPDAKCASARSVEDGEPWWPNDPLENVDESFLWQPNYLSDYSASDGDIWPVRDTSGRLMDEDEPWDMRNLLAQYLMKHNKDGSFLAVHGLHPRQLGNPLYYEAKHPQLTCPKCPPVFIDDGEYLRPPPPYSLSRYERNALGPDLYLSKYVLPTEHPMLSSTVRHLDSWVKSPKATSVSKKSISTAKKQLEHHPPAPWSFLSKLLMSYPTFRDSSHVIPI